MTIDDTNFRELFPRTKFRFGIRQQLDVIAGEVEETREAVFIDDDALLKEALDIIQATFSLLYNEGYSNQQIIDTLKKVQDKNRKRGYYEE